MSGMPRTAPLPFGATALPLGATAGLIGLSLTLGGCGTADPQLPAAPSPTVARQASFPLTVSRHGGIAGFSDSISIQDDGGALATTKQGKVTCTIDRASLAVLNEAGRQLNDTDQPTGSPTGQSDQLDVFFGAGTGLVPLDDERVAKAAPVVTQLLADVTGPKSGRKICT
jgi:hypothetical protein